MPESRTIFESGYGPPGGLPGGHNPRERYITRILVDNLYEMHQIDIKFLTGVQGQEALSVKEYRSESHRTMRRWGMPERSERVTNFYQSRTRFPAKQLYQQRDLRHGGQGSITINNPIMEE